MYKLRQHIADDIDEDFQYRAARFPDHFRYSVRYERPGPGVDVRSMLYTKGKEYNRESENNNFETAFVFLQDNITLIAQNTCISYDTVKAWISIASAGNRLGGMVPGVKASSPEEATRVSSIIRTEGIKLFREYVDKALKDHNKRMDAIDEAAAKQRAEKEKQLLEIEKQKKLAVEAEAASQKAIQEELDKAKKEFEAAEIAAKKQMEEFKSLSASLDILKTSKTTADQVATSQEQALNIVINNLNGKKMQSVTLAKVMLLKAAPGATIANAQIFPNVQFTANADQVYKTPQDEGRKHCITLDGVKPNTANKQELINAKNTANQLSGQIKAQKDLLDQAALSLKNGRTHADTKAQEYRNDISAKQNLITLEQQKIDLETININTQILNALNTQDASGETPLIKACKQSNVEAIKYIFQASNAAYARNIIFDLKDNDGKTALHYGISNGMTLESKLLLDKGASPYLPDSQGYTAHMLAVSSGQTQLRDEMIRKCGQAELTPELRTKIFGNATTLNAQDEFGDSLFIKACKDGKVATIKYVLQFGVRNLALDLQNLAGKTALHILIEKNMTQEARILLEQGANPYIADVNGTSAYDQALTTTQDLCSLMVQKFGPPPNVINQPPTIEELAEAARTNQAYNSDDDDLESTASDLSHLGERLFGLGLAGNTTHQDDEFGG